MIIEILSNPSELKKVRSIIGNFCKDNCKKIEIFKVKLSVDEALQNIIRHAYKMDKTKKIVERKLKKKRYNISLSIADEKDYAVAFVTISI